MLRDKVREDRIIPCAVSEKMLRQAQNQRAHNRSHALVYWEAVKAPGSTRRKRLSCKWCKKQKLRKDTKYHCEACMVGQLPVGLCKKCFVPWHNHYKLRV